MTFEWDQEKNMINFEKHGIYFDHAQYAFGDSKRVIRFDVKHSDNEEKRYFCFGRVDDRIVTVRFTLRNDNIRIFGAGYWREGKEIYEEENGL
jgi:hypothetical protein